MRFPQTFQSILNQVGFGWRNWLRWQRGGYYCEQTRQGKERDLWPEYALPLGPLERHLVEKYDLRSFQESCSLLRYKETLSYLVFLETLLAEASFPAHRPLRWLDVGAKNWSYVHALVAIIERKIRCDHYTLTGIELDPYRIYRDLHSRYDYARSFIQRLPNVCYLVGDVLSLGGEYDIITSFLPFVFKEPHLAWGLPLTHFKPERYLAHLVHLLAPGGLLLVLNQGDVEAQRQHALFQELCQEGSFLEVYAVGRMPNTFIDYKHPRFGWQCRKTTNMDHNGHIRMGGLSDVND